MDVSFQLIWVITKGSDCYSYENAKRPLKWLYHSACPPAPRVRAALHWVPPAVWDVSPSDRCPVVSRGFTLQFPPLMIYDEHLFIQVSAISVSSLVEHLSTSFALLHEAVFLLSSVKSSVYILDTSPSSATCFAKTFSQSVACLFILLTVSFAEKFLILMISSWLNFSFHRLCAGCFM